MSSMGTQGPQVRDIVGRNMKEIFQWTIQTEFGQDNGMTRITAGLLQNWKGSTYFTGGRDTVPTTLKLHFNPCI